QVSNAAALLLRNTDLLRYVPQPGFNGGAKVSYRAWDETTGIPGGRMAASGTPFSLAIETALMAGKNAPVLTPGSPTLPALLEDNLGSPGVPVATIFPVGTVTDADGLPSPGVAVVGTTGDGTWQFSTDGVIWRLLGTPSESAAVLVRGVDKIRFVPSLNFNGT